MYKCQNLDYCGVLPGKNMYGVVHLFAKKYSVLIVASPMPLRSSSSLENGSGCYLGLKLALESANVTSKVWPFGLFAKPFFPGVIVGSHLKIPFFSVTPKSLKPTTQCVVKSLKKSHFSKLHVSYFFISSWGNIGDWRQ